ncbi:uncharacterized protein LOC117780287 [Drosophila innubila]|uniref:uncharacterized protein LOC117780287 n=1 Tax=Drosophila innubila TaxID=198719 RepID=UPI00148D3E04|nr:uncharacterized protein LOC117780287 [Drosophila innubila]
MMRKSLLMSTLNAVEQVEFVFEQTLRTIDEINHRYNIVSGLKRKADKRQQSYESEILAAITEPTFTKISNRQKKRKKRKKCKKRTAKKSQTMETQKKKTEDQDIHKQKKFDDSFICRYDNRRYFDTESIVQMDWEEFGNDWNCSSENSDETDKNLCSGNTHYCSSCRCTTIYFNLTS